MNTKSPQYLREYLTLNYSKLIKYLVGLCLLALGISFIIQSQLGAAPWDLLAVSLASVSALTIGTWQIVFNVMMIVLTTVLFSRRINVLCLIPGVIIGVLIDCFLLLLADIPLSSFFYLIVGILLSGAGLALYVNQNVTANAIDNFTFQMHKSYRLPLSVAKLLTDAIPIFILVIFFMSKLTLITVVIYICVPLAIRFWSQLFKRMALI